MAKKNGYKSGDIPQGNGNYLTGKIPGKLVGMLGSGGKLSKVPGFGGKSFGGSIPQPKGYAKCTGQFAGGLKSLKNTLLKGK